MSTSKQVQHSVPEDKLEQAAGKIDQAKDVIGGTKRLASPTYMSTSEQVQHSVSEDKLDQAAGKIDQAKDVIGGVERLASPAIMSTSEQFQHSVSKDKLEQAAGKVDQAKDVIGGVKRLASPTTDKSFKAEIGKSKDFLVKKLNKLDFAALPRKQRLPESSDTLSVSHTGESSTSEKDTASDETKDVIKGGVKRLASSPTTEESNESPVHSMLEVLESVRFVNGKAVEYKKFGEQFVNSTPANENLEKISKKVYDASIMMDQIKNLMAIEIRVPSTNMSASLESKTARAMQTLQSNVHNLDIAANNLSKSMYTTLQTLDSLVDLYDERSSGVTFEVETQYMDMPSTYKVYPLVAKLLSQHSSIFYLPSFILRREALEEQIELLKQNQLQLEDTRENISSGLELDKAEALIVRHKNSLRDEQREASAKVKQMLWKEKLRMFFRKVESVRHDDTGSLSFGEPTLEEVCNIIRKSNRTQGAMGIYVKSRKNNYLKEVGVEFYHFFKALEELGRENVAEGIAQYFLTLDKKDTSHVKENEDEFIQQLQHWVKTTMFRDFRDYLDCVKRIARGGIHVKRGDKMRTSWKSGVLKTVDLKWDWQPHTENQFLHARTNYHFEKALNTGVDTKSIVCYEFLQKVQLKSPLFDQDFTLLEDFAATSDVNQFEVVETEFFGCLFPSFNI